MKFTSIFFLKTFVLADMIGVGMVLFSFSFYCSLHFYFNILFWIQ